MKGVNPSDISADDLDTIHVINRPASQVAERKSTKVDTTGSIEDRKSVLNISGIPLRMPSGVTAL